MKPATAARRAAVVEFGYGSHRRHRSRSGRRSNESGVRGPDAAVGAGVGSAPRLRPATVDLPRCADDVGWPRRVRAAAAGDARGRQPAGRVARRVRVLTGPQRCSWQRAGDDGRAAARGRRRRRRRLRRRAARRRAGSRCSSPRLASALAYADAMTTGDVSCGVVRTRPRALRRRSDRRAHRGDRVGERIGPVQSGAAPRIATPVARLATRPGRRSVTGVRSTSDASDVA